MIGTIQTEKAKEREKDEEKQKNISASGKATSVRGAGGGHGGVSGSVAASGGDAGEDGRKHRKHRSGRCHAEKSPYRGRQQHGSRAEGHLGLCVVWQLPAGGSDTKRRGIHSAGCQPAAGWGRPCFGQCVRRPSERVRVGR